MTEEEFALWAFWVRHIQQREKKLVEDCLIQEPKLKMTPCIERQPEKDGRYLVQRDCFGFTDCSFEGGKWQCEPLPSAWCELPEVPEDEYRVCSLRGGGHDACFIDFNGRRVRITEIDDRLIISSDGCTCFEIRLSHVRKLLPLLKRFLDTGSIAP